MRVKCVQKFRQAVRRREQKQRKLSDHDHSFRLVVSSTPHYRAEFQYLISKMAY